jgi:hypothetical protein
MEQQEKYFFRHRWAFFILEFLIIIFSIAIGFLGSHLFFREKEDLILLKDAKGILVKNSFFEIPADPLLEYGMIRGMLQTIGDPNTYFVEPASAEVQANELSGSFGGIGIRLERDIQFNWRVYPLPDSPALKAGIKDADLLLSIDDLIITN